MDVDTNYYNYPLISTVYKVVDYTGVEYHNDKYHASNHVAQAFNSHNDDYKIVEAKSEHTRTIWHVMDSDMRLLTERAVSIEDAIEVIKQIRKEKESETHQDK